MANSFAPKESSISLKRKTPPFEPEPVPHQSGNLTLPSPKPKRKQCSLYLDAGMMDQVRCIASKKGVTIGAVIEACVKASLESLEK